MDGFTFVLGIVGIVALCGIIVVAMISNSSMTTKLRPSELSIEVNKPDSLKPIEDE